MIDIVLNIVHRLSSPDPRFRELAADEVTDVLESLGALGPALAAVLALARLGESDAAAQEAELHALSELDEWGHVSDDVRELLTGVDPTTVRGSQVEYPADLLHCP